MTIVCGRLYKMKQRLQLFKLFITKFCCFLPYFTLYMSQEHSKMDLQYIFVSDSGNH